MNSSSSLQNLNPNKLKTESSDSPITKLLVFICNMLTANNELHDQQMRDWQKNHSKIKDENLVSETRVVESKLNIEISIQNLPIILQNAASFSEFKPLALKVAELSKNATFFTKKVPMQNFNNTIYNKLHNNNTSSSIQQQQPITSHLSSICIKKTLPPRERSNSSSSLTQRNDSPHRIFTFKIDSKRTPIPGSTDMLDLQKEEAVKAPLTSAVNSRFLATASDFFGADANCQDDIANKQTTASSDGVLTKNSTPEPEIESPTLNSPNIESAELEKSNIQVSELNKIESQKIESKRCNLQQQNSSQSTIITQSPQNSIEFLQLQKRLAELEHQAEVNKLKEKIKELESKSSNSSNSSTTNQNQIQSTDQNQIQSAATSSSGVPAPQAPQAPQIQAPTQIQTQIQTQASTSTTTAKQVTISPEVKSKEFNSDEPISFDLYNLYSDPEFYEYKKLYRALLKYENHILVLRTHRENGTHPKCLNWIKGKLPYNLVNSHFKQNIFKAKFIELTLDLNLSWLQETITIMNSKLAVSKSKLLDLHPRNLEKIQRIQEQQKSSLQFNFERSWSKVNRIMADVYTPNSRSFNDRSSGAKSYNSGTESRSESRIAEPSPSTSSNNNNNSTPKTPTTPKNSSTQQFSTPKHNNQNQNQSRNFNHNRKFNRNQNFNRNRNFNHNQNQNHNNNNNFRRNKRFRKNSEQKSEQKSESNSNTQTAPTQTQNQTQTAPTQIALPSNNNNNNNSIPPQQFVSNTNSIPNQFFTPMHNFIQPQQFFPNQFFTPNHFISRPSFY